MSAALEEKRHRQLSEQRKLRRTEALVRTEAGLNEAERKRVKKNEANRKYRASMKQRQDQNIEAELSSRREVTQDFILEAYHREKKRKAENNSRNYQKRQEIKQYIKRHGLIMGTAFYQQSIVERNMEDYIREQIIVKEKYDRCKTVVEANMEDYIRQQISIKERYDRCQISIKERYDINDYEWLFSHDKTMAWLSETDKKRIAGIWKRYLDPPFSIRKWLEDYDKKFGSVMQSFGSVIQCERRRTEAERNTVNPPDIRENVLETQRERIHETTRKERRAEQQRKRRALKRPNHENDLQQIKSRERVAANMERFIRKQISDNPKYKYDSCKWGLLNYTPKVSYPESIYKKSSYMSYYVLPSMGSDDREWCERKDKAMMGLSEIDKNRVAGIWKRYLEPPGLIRKWLEGYDKKVHTCSATPLSSNELQQIIVESDMEHYIREQISNKRRMLDCTSYDREWLERHDKAMMGLSEIEKNRMMLTCCKCMMSSSSNNNREWRERHDKAMRGLSEIEKNRIAEIWKRYLDPPSSIRKCLEEYDKKVHTCSATPLSSNACILCSILDLECQHTHTVYATTTLSKTTAIICTVQPLFNRQCKCQPPMGSKPI
jgi:hypothetical protein